MLPRDELTIVMAFLERAMAAIEYLPDKQRRGIASNRLEAIVWLKRRATSEFDETGVTEARAR